MLAPELRRRAERSGPLDLLRPARASRSRVGDEAHHRTEEGTALTLEALGIEHPEVRAFIAGNGQFFLNLAMVFAKLALDCAADVPGSPVLTAIARNGVEVGIRVSGHRRPVVRRPGRAARPGEAVRRLHAGRHEPGPRRLRDRRDLRARRAGHRRFADRRRRRSGSTPADDRWPSTPSCGRSRPASRRTSASRTAAPAILGIDARKVAATRISPPVHTGIAHKQPGIGQIGGGVTHPPLAAFDLAVEASLTRAEEVHRELRAALLARRVPVRPAARRGAARRALRDEPDAGARGAAAARGRRPRRARPLRRRAPNAPRVSVDARALRRAHRARGPRGAHRRPRPPRRAARGVARAARRARRRRRTSCYADEGFHEAHRARHAATAPPSATCATSTSASA